MTNPGGAIADVRAAPQFGTSSAFSNQMRQMARDLPERGGGRYAHQVKYPNLSAVDWMEPATSSLGNWMSIESKEQWRLWRSFLNHRTLIFHGFAADRLLMR
jgi:hypothetical protein